MWANSPNEMLIKALEKGYHVVMANPIGNELEYIVEKTVPDTNDESEGQCAIDDCNVTDTNVENKQYPDDMDKECIPLCDLFNSIGLTTQFSCCGHGESPFQIIFADNVYDKQIYDFIDMLSQDKGHTPIVGSFLKWMRKVDDKIVLNWTYQVDKIEWADLDLENMKKYMR